MAWRRCPSCRQVRCRPSPERALRISPLRGSHDRTHSLFHLNGRLGPRAGQQQMPWMEHEIALHHTALRHPRHIKREAS